MTDHDPSLATPAASDHPPESTHAPIQDSAPEHASSHAVADGEVTVAGVTAADEEPAAHEESATPEPPAAIEASAPPVAEPPAETPGAHEAAPEPPLGGQPASFEANAEVASATVEPEMPQAGERVEASGELSASEALAASAPEPGEAEAIAQTGEVASGDVPSGEAASGETETTPGAPRPPKGRSDAELAALRRRAQESWQRVVAAKDSGELLEGTVIAVVKGGALVDISGVRGFLPASQVRAPEGGTLEALIKTKLSLKILDTEPGRRRAVVSNRRALEEQRRSKRAEVLASLKVGERREGTIVRLTDFGAFVDLGGIDGLIPMSELAVERVEKAADVVSVGEKLMVDVLRVDEGGKKISLSRKSALPDPWRDSIAALRVGNVVQGTVVGFEPRFTVEIAPGVNGTIRDSDADPTEYAVGESIEVTIRNIDRRTRRITLVPSFGGAQAEALVQPRQSQSGFAPLGVELERALAKARSAAERGGSGGN